MERTPAARTISVVLAVLTLLALAMLPGAAAGSGAVSPAPPVGVRSALLSLLAEAESDVLAAAASATASGAARAPGSEPGSIETSAPRLPACEYRDELTRYHEVRHWRKTLLDTILKVRRSYVPWDLVSVSRADIRGSGMVRRVVIDDLSALARAARRAGKPLAVRSAYRSYQTQVATFRSWVERSGYQQALRFSARPGHSEHQLGTTIDFTTAPGVPLSSTFGDSPAGRWLARNSWRYGFIMSYPQGQRRVSCYGYEPWHFRYVGRDLARRIHESGQVPRRFFWQHFETAP